ncbi:MAG TPA: hypothetical protein VF570_18930 [Pyrinomonadaceae bacterium]|jgi:hypothetical protein
MPLAAKRCLSLLSLSLLCLFLAPVAGATVFRDRAAFESASQNLHTLDFEDMRRGELPREATIDGLNFLNYIGYTGIAQNPGTDNNVLYATGLPEITVFYIILPPGTTAVGLDQFSRPMEVLTSTGEKVVMTAGDGSDFVGFVTDQPIQRLTVTLDNPEPAPYVLLDNLSYGQRRAGNEPPRPLLLTYGATERAAAFESVGLTAEPFTVTTPATHNLSADGRTRVALLVAGVRLDAPGEAAFVTARAVDSQQRAFDLPVEAVGGTKNLSWLAQVNVLLPPELAGAGELSVSVTVRGVESNKATLRVN